jgi:hypothetical protein
MLTSVAATAGAALAPKCPFCVVAILSACGIGVGMGTAGALALLARPLAVLVAAGALALVLRRFVRPRTLRAASGGCAACDLSPGHRRRAR